jgi:glyoxylase-like metal-dependent hydrolase (beta-lactamase superfamily II)
MASIRELAEEHWQGRGELVHTHHPVQPIHDHHDDGTRTTAAEEIEDGLLTLKSIASVNALDTGDGLVMLDTGGQFDRHTVYDTVRGWRPDAPLAAAVYSHHHIDHVLGTALFDAEAADNGWERPVVYAHQDVPSHFRRYEQTQGWNTAINRRQFAIDLPQFSWPGEYRDPDVTYAEQLTFTRGELTFELRHARGETDDATWTYVPERKVLHPGDLFIWAVPNAGNPQKVQRYLSDWATALREMAALRPEIMLSGHGLPIFGADRIVAALTDTAELLESVESQTLAIMNQGKNLDTCLHEVDDPGAPVRQAVPAAGVRPSAVPDPQRVAALRRLVSTRPRRELSGDVLVSRRTRRCPRSSPPGRDPTASCRRTGPPGRTPRRG